MVKRSRSRKVSRKEHFGSYGSYAINNNKGGKRNSVKKSKGKKCKKDTKSKNDTKCNKQSCLQKMNDPKLMLYCFKCKQKRIMDENGRQCVKTKNNRDAIKAMCSVCGGKCQQFV
jgi:hypothetical protein